MRNGNMRIRIVDRNMMFFIRECNEPLPLLNRATAALRIFELLSAVEIQVEW
jgi:hypothetical protein